jgi:hypothetical protein
MNDAYMIYPCNRKEVKNTGILKNDKKSNNYIMIGSNSTSFNNKKDMDCSSKKYTQYGTGNLKNYLKTKNTTDFIHDFRNMYNLNLEHSDQSITSDNTTSSNYNDSNHVVYNNDDNSYNCNSDYHAESEPEPESLSEEYTEENIQNDIITDNSSDNNENIDECCDDDSINSFEY